MSFFFKQKTAYEMRISDWSSDVCSSDLQSKPGVRLETLLYGCKKNRDVHGQARHPYQASDGRVIREISEQIGKPEKQPRRHQHGKKIGRASCRERVCQYG